VLQGGAKVAANPKFSMDIRSILTPSGAAQKNKIINQSECLETQKVEKY